MRELEFGCRRDEGSNGLDGAERRKGELLGFYRMYHNVVLRLTRRSKLRFTLVSRIPGSCPTAQGVGFAETWFRRDPQIVRHGRPRTLSSTPRPEVRIWGLTLRGTYQFGGNNFIPRLKHSPRHGAGATFDMAKGDHFHRLFGSSSGRQLVSVSTCHCKSNPRLDR